MNLALYGHPFSSYTQKALIALYENELPFDFKIVGPEVPENFERLGRLRSFRCSKRTAQTCSKPPRSSNIFTSNIRAPFA